MFRLPATIVLAASLMATMLASTAIAQTPAPIQRSYVEMSTTAGMPEFRDPKTGQIWTPANVGRGRSASLRRPISHSIRWRKRSGSRAS